MKKTNKKTSRKNRKYTRKAKGGSPKKHHGMLSSARKSFRKLLGLKKPLMSSTKFNKLKDTLTHIKLDDLVKNETYYIEEIGGCSLERGVFEDTFYQGIYRGGYFKNIELLYKDSKEECADFPRSYTQPVYAEDNDTEIGRSSQIRLSHEHKFYKE
jgi:hypothetical protein